ncbi:MAG: Flp pilus assembly protein CpaB [Alphaproteobacteria bacterium 41-28]|nr:MAG: Flp pilus assembly protein CpaB [Alphaproteobacteria bacterium 41-28]
MRLKDIIGLILALILAIGVAFLTRFFLTKQEKPKQEISVQPAHLTKIFVAGNSLHEGDKIKPGDIVLQEWPQNSMNSNYIKEGTVRPSDLVGSIVRGHLEKGEPITATSLVKPGEKGILAAVVAPGLRAISIDVTAQSASSGLIAPGDYVDVILSKSVTPAAGAQFGESKTIATKVKVLAIDTELSDTHEKPKNVPHVATLEVTPVQAEHITAAIKEGTISLSLHSLDATAHVEHEGTLPKKAPQKEETITIMRGKEKTEIKMQEK